MSNLVDRITNSQIWRSFFRHGWPDNPLDRSLVMTTNIFFHLHPVKVNRKSLEGQLQPGVGSDFGHCLPGCCRSQDCF